MNDAGTTEWEVPCHVTEAGEPVAFEWVTIDPANPGAIWRFDLTELRQHTRDRFSVRIGETNNGVARPAGAAGVNESGVINARRATSKANMQATLDGIKQEAESTPIRPSPAPGNRT